MLFFSDQRLFLAAIFHLLGLLLQVGWTPLHSAADGGFLELVEHLLGAGAAVDARTEVSPRTGPPTWLPPP
jgi:ankyrin repeat protein